MNHKRAFLYGIAASFFFAFTFLLNRNMHLSGGSWYWSASLRYLFTFPIMALIVWKKYRFLRVHGVIAKKPWVWILWSTIGFGIFYAPLSFAGDYGESWLIAASWQITIVMGVLMAPLFGSRISPKNLLAAGIILFGIALLQIQNILKLNLYTLSLTLFPMLLAAMAYPLGNRKMMVVCQDEISTTERIYGMTLCSLPFWILLSAVALSKVGTPSPQQALQSLGSALFSGVIATMLFFKATDLVKSDQRQLAAVESTQSGEVLFTLLGGVFLLHDTPPDGFGILGICLIVFGMILNSFLSSLSPKEKS